MGNTPEVWATSKDRNNSCYYIKYYAESLKAAYGLMAPRHALRSHWGLEPSSPHMLAWILFSLLF